MSLEPALGKLLFDAIKILAEGAKRILRIKHESAAKERAQKRVSQAIRELLKSDPHIASAVSMIAEARQVLNTPTPELLRAEEMLHDVKNYGQPRVIKKAKRKTGAKRLRRANKKVAIKKKTRRTRK